MDPDELYTLRAQYWLGHYNLCVDEAKSISRRPMSAQLKVEREEFYLRALLGLKRYDDVIREASGGDKGSGIQAIALRAQYDSPSTSPSSKQTIITSLQQLLADPTSSTTTQLISAQTFLLHGEMTKEALACVHTGTTMEHLAISLQIYLRMDRLDLARSALSTMKAKDEEAVLTQLAAIHTHLYVGRSEVNDAIHSLGSLTEQYGNSPMLLNLNGAAFLVAGQYENAERVLNECIGEEADAGSSSDTLINLVVCYQHLGKGMDVVGPVLEQLKGGFPEHPFVVGLARVEGAFERETAKYNIAA